MRIGVAATPEVAIPTMEWLLHSGHELCLVISQPDRAAGRGLELKASPVSQWAIGIGIPLLRPETPAELVGAVSEVDLVLTIGYGVLLPQEILDLPRYGFINLHFSLLPSYRGAAPVQRAIEHGESLTGVTVFKLDKGMDTGPIYSSATLEIAPEWRTSELMAALSTRGPQVVAEALTSIEELKAPTPQAGASSLAPKISKNEAKILWSADARTTLNRIRAFFPAPVAWCLFRGDSFKITSAQASEAKLKPGEIAVIDGDVVVGCSDATAICLLKVIPAGKKEMDAKDWARGARLSNGELLG